MNMYLLLVLSILAVFLGSFVFVNAIEYAGGLMKWSRSFVGSIISPFFTSFPELIVFVIAIFYADHGKDIAIGVIFGEPFISSSLAYTLVLVAITFSLFAGAAKRRKSLNVDRSIAYPYAFVSILYPLLILAGYITRRLDMVLGVGFLIAYLVYVYVMYKSGAEEDEEHEKPFLSRFMDARAAVGIQLAVSIVLLYYGSELLVHSVSDISTSIGISALTLSILLIPFATAIPETLTAMIWGYQGKDSMAISSLVGEKVLYTTLYPGIALLAIPWVINESAVISVITAEVVSLVYIFYIRRGKFPLYALSFGVVFFIIYVFLIF